MGSLGRGLREGSGDRAGASKGTRRKGLSAFEKAIIDLAKEGAKAFFQSAREAFQADLKAQQAAFQHKLDVEKAKIEAITEQIKAGRRASDGQSQADESAARLRAAYAYLGVQATDPDEMVKAVYRAKSKFTHPDSGAGDEEGFKRLSSAYEIVMKARRGSKNGGK